MVVGMNGLWQGKTDLNSTVYLAKKFKATIQKIDGAKKFHISDIFHFGYQGQHDKVKSKQI
jgi:hypothetical protein